MDLSLNLRAIVAQQLLPTKDGSGRRAAIEVLVNTPLVQDTVRKGDVHLLKEIMAKSPQAGMRTFDQALFELYEVGEIDYEVALSHADSPNDLRLMIKMGKDHESGARFEGVTDKLSLEETEASAFGR
jgi:twitching motility protein PilU